MSYSPSSDLVFFNPEKTEIPMRKKELKAKVFQPNCQRWDTSALALILQGLSTQIVSSAPQLGSTYKPVIINDWSLICKRILCSLPLHPEFSIFLHFNFYFSFSSGGLALLLCSSSPCSLLSWCVLPSTKLKIKEATEFEKFLWAKEQAEAETQSMLFLLCPGTRPCLPSGRDTFF